MYAKFMNLSFQTRLMIFFIISALVPLIVLGVFTYQKSSELSKEQVSQQVLEGMTQINRNLTFFNQDIQQLSHFIYRSEIVQNALEKRKTRSEKEKYQDFIQVRELLSTLTDSKNWDLDIYLIGLNDDRYFTGEYLSKQYDQYMENWGIFRKVKAANGALVWETNYTIRKVDANEVVLSAGQLLKEPSTGKPLGYLIIDITESDISRIYQQEESQFSQTMFLLDEGGYVISSYPSKSTVGLKFQHSSTETVLANEKGYTKTTFQDKPSIMVYDTGLETQYKMVTFIPEDEVIEKNKIFGYVTISLLIIGLIIGLWLAYFFAKTLTNPINKLIHLMEKVEKGDLSVRFHFKYSDEIGNLGNRFNHMLTQMNTLIHESVEKQTRLTEAELHTLRAQINPHFLYNTLETISTISKLRGVKIVSDISLALGKIFRFSINKDKEFVKLEEEVELLRHYLFIQEVRFEDKIIVTIDMEEEAGKCMIPVLLIQPLVENALSHGLELKETQGHLQINIYCIKKTLWIKIQDDGLGMSEERIQEVLNEKETIQNQRPGVGLANVRKRLNLYYGAEYGLTIKSQENKGTIITLKLPETKEGE